MAPGVEATAGALYAGIRTSNPRQKAGT
jgi:hypothetical protein